MALKRVGWENGTLVFPAKVLSDGTIQPAQYEGTTPLNASNLKKMEDNTENFVNEQVGDLSTLSTTHKENVVSSINELSTNTNKMDVTVANIKGKLLWTNPKPSESFSAQTISTDLSEYDVIEIWFKHFYTENHIFSCRMLKNSNQLVSYLERDAGHGTRIVTTSNTNVYFGSAEYCSNTFEVKTANTRIIPLYIVGYKNGLF